MTSELAGGHRGTLLTAGAGGSRDGGRVCHGAGGQVHEHLVGHVRAVAVAPTTSPRLVSRSMRAAAPASTGPCPSPGLHHGPWAARAAVATTATSVAGSAAVSGTGPHGRPRAASSATVSRVPGTGWETAAQVDEAMLSKARGRSQPGGVGGGGGHLGQGGQRLGDEEPGVAAPRRAPSATAPVAVATLGTGGGRSRGAAQREHHVGAGVRVRDGEDVEGVDEPHGTVRPG